MNAMFGPRIDTDFVQAFGRAVMAGQGPVTGQPQISGYVACMRTLPGVYDVCPLPIFPTARPLKNPRW